MLVTIPTIHHVKKLTRDLTVNESQKTGIFWGVAVIAALIAGFVAWPSSTSEEGGDYAGLINEPLFAEFKDPLTAASMKVVTFDDVQGELKNFEVRKDADTGLWTIPSKGGYPADAVEQMRDAANSLVDLKALDIPTDNAEDHPGMGVVEPKLEDLDVGDEGVGRLVTFKDASQKVLASLIIGSPVKDQPGQVYVRKPGQDPVYVVTLEDKPLTTKFQDWIEEDLLQLSSIDVEDLEIKDYSASFGLQGFSQDWNYTAKLAKDGSQWKLVSLKEYDERNQPTPVEIDDEKSLNTQKLNDLNNALDDLKFVDVRRKPEGISANLRADKEFVTDQESATQLAARGFIPAQARDGEIEILSANGEMTATTKEGVQYILRFGNISGVEDSDGGESADDQKEEQETDAAGGVNRYLMVSTVVDESKFPAPELKPIPQNLEDLEALDNPKSAEAEKPADEKPDMEDAEAVDDKESAPEEEDAEQKKADSDETEAEKDSETAEKNQQEVESESKESEDDKSADDAEGDAELSGEGESTTIGEAQEDDTPADDTPAEKESDSAETSSAGKESADDEAEPATESEPAEAASEEKNSGADAKNESSTDEVAETEEEKLERLAAIQEKITKENERKLEERKDKLAIAKRRSRELNERFADWYYVIPEETYAKLQIGRDELFEKAESDAAATGNPAAGSPQFNIPGFPGGAPGN